MVVKSPRMVIEESTREERRPLWFASVTILLLSLFRLALFFIEEVQAACEQYLHVPLANTMVNGLFFWLLILLWIAYRRWREVILRQPSSKWPPQRGYFPRSAWSGTFSVSRITRRFGLTSAAPIWPAASWSWRGTCSRGLSSAAWSTFTSRYSSFAATTTWHRSRSRQVTTLVPVA